MKSNLMFFKCLFELSEKRLITMNPSTKEVHSVKLKI